MRGGWGCRFGVACTALLSSPSMAQEVPKGSFELVWADEFDRDGAPNPAKWNWDIFANKTGWHNGERQYYAADRPENARIENGRLIITARKETLSDRADHGGQRYSSARLTTQGKAEFASGLIEVRAKLPCGEGLWPAIWTLGATTPWPDSGSIDIMEFDRKASAVTGTVHNISTSGTAGNGGRVDVADACGAFHDYQLLWTPRELRFAVDGKPYHRYANAGTGMAQWPFDKAHYLILSLAVRGADREVADDAIFPARFEIEHVRIYKQRPRESAAVDGAGQQVGDAAMIGE